MKVNVMGLLSGAALELRHTAPGRAYALLEMANNLRLVLRGEATLDEFAAVYVGADGEALDIDQLLPTPGVQT